MKYGRYKAMDTDRPVGTFRNRVNTCTLCGGREYHDQLLIFEAPQRKVFVCPMCNCKYSKNILKKLKERNKIIIKTMEAR